MQNHVARKLATIIIYCSEEKEKKSFLRSGSGSKIKALKKYLKKKNRKERSPIAGRERE